MSQKIEGLNNSDLKFAEDTANEKSTTNVVPFVSKKRRIIIVDDDQAILESLGSILEQYEDLNCEPILFTGGNPAMEFLLKKPDLRIDLVLSDVRMDDGDGYSFIARFRRVFPDTPFYFMTGYSDLSEQMAIDKGATGLIKKPFSLSKIISKILPNYPVKEVYE